MSPEDFKREYLCTFEVDKRQLELDNRVNDYFTLVDSDLPDLVILEAKRQLLNWVKLSGYTNEEYLASRKRYRYYGQRLY